MGRKSSAKEQRSTTPPTPPTASPARGIGRFVLGAVIVGVVGLGLSAFWGRHSIGTAGASAAADSANPSDASPKPPDPSEMTKNETAAHATAALGPHKQANLPPIPFRGYAPPRPPEVVKAAFEFAAEHPEVLSYVPCFCGCQQMGHRGNEDCFVKSRAPNGDVTAWEEHGIECAVCIDVATRSRQMYASGASVHDIRAAIEKDFASKFPSMTPTPKPPAASH